jgi:isocitrate dehydrogenase kinase/phosphatase
VKRRGLIEATQTGPIQPRRRRLSAAKRRGLIDAIAPWRPQLFTVLGRAKQGKTERFRELMRHLEQTRDQFVHAAGERGLVMVCFTLPSFDVVFKIIRDRFPYPKSVLREEVMAKYQLVFKHDSAGRLVDAQEFKKLQFPVAQFAPPAPEPVAGRNSDDSTPKATTWSSTMCTSNGG